MEERRDEPMARMCGGGHACNDRENKRLPVGLEEISRGLREWMGAYVLREEQCAYIFEPRLMGELSWRKEISCMFLHLRLQLIRCGF